MRRPSSIAGVRYKMRHDPPASPLPLKHAEVARIASSKRLPVRRKLAEALYCR